METQVEFAGSEREGGEEREVRKEGETQRGKGVWIPGIVQR